jgi:murein L,D-transpeptidase YafK
MSRASRCAGAALCLAALAASPPSNGASVTAELRAPAVDRIVVRKSDHKITLFAGEVVAFETTVAIGPGGAGPKLREGDQVTPVGRYRILAKSPSRFRTFMRLDYPNADDRARFAKLKAAGVLPKHARIGGDIGIHGPLPGYEAGNKLADWTLGCVAVDAEEIDAIAKLAPVGTIVDIVD